MSFISNINKSYDATFNNVSVNKLTVSEIIIEDLEVTNITIDGELLVSNAMIQLIPQTNESTIQLLGNGLTVGLYLEQLDVDSSASYRLNQIASGDNDSQSILMSAGGNYGKIRNSIQSFDTFRNENLSLAINPLGGFVGINTNEPNCALDVKGDLNVSGIVNISEITPELQL